MTSLQNVIAREYAIPEDKQVLLISGGDSLDPVATVGKYHAGTVDLCPVTCYQGEEGNDVLNIMLLIRIYVFINIRGVAILSYKCMLYLIIRNMQRALTYLFVWAKNMSFKDGYHHRTLFNIEPMEIFIKKKIPYRNYTFGWT